MITTPVGIDVEIQRQQQRLAAKLWTGKNYESYGHAFINVKEDGSNVPEVFVNNIDYKDVLTDDKNDAISFFIVDDNMSGNSMAMSVDVKLYFIVNLAKIYPTLTHRAVEESHRDALIYILQHNNVTDIVTGAKALRDFNIPQYQTDMQPYHAFCLTLEMNYQYDSNCL